MNLGSQNGSVKASDKPPKRGLIPGLINTHVPRWVLAGFWWSAVLPRL